MQLERRLKLNFKRNKITLEFSRVQKLQIQAHIKAKYSKLYLKSSFQKGPIHWRYYFFVNTSCSMACILREFIMSAWSSISTTYLHKAVFLGGGQQKVTDKKTFKILYNTPPPTASFYSFRHSQTRFQAVVSFTQAKFHLESV